MRKIIYNISWILVLQVILFGCKEEEPVLETPPPAEAAVFTFTSTTESDNIINLTNDGPGFLKKWDFGNGETAEGNTVQVTYPFQGEYEVTLTIFTSGGSATSKQTIVIEKTDLSLLKPVYTLLTGGDAYPEGKAWVIDASRAGHFGIGPADAASPIWWAAPPNDKSGTGLYDDKHIFKLDQLTFVQETNGDVYLNGAQQANFPGAYVNKGDYTAPYDGKENLRWSVSENAQEKQFITINGGGFIGYFAGSYTYEILSISENELNIKYIDAAVPANAWFLRLIPEGFEPPPPPPPATTTLPADFEGAKPPFNGFGGSTYDVVDNPSATGINTSAKVGQYVKGGDGNWAGIETTLNATLDFATNTTIKYKVYSPVTGRALFKIEEAGNNQNFVEVFADITKVNEWEELSFDFTGTTGGVYNKFALFLDFDNNAGGTFYFDDIRQIAPSCDDADNVVLDPTSLNLTMGTTTFGQFGNIASDKVENPFKTGINTSCFVNSYQKNGGCEVWSGAGLLLATPIDFATVTKKKFKLKVYAVNQVTDVTLRLERLPHPDVEPSAERTATITAVGEWQELTFDFSDITDPNTYKNVIIYFEKGAACDNDLYYFDDLIQVQ
jgi:hypothetical protein